MPDQIESPSPVSDVQPPETTNAPASVAAEASESADAALTRAAEAAVSGKSRDDIARAFSSEDAAEGVERQDEVEGKPSTDEPQQEAPAEPEEPSSPGQPAANLPDRDRHLLSRFQLDPEDLPADAQRRERFLGNLRQRAADQDRMGREFAEFQRRLSRNPGDPGEGEKSPETQQPQQGAIQTSDELLKPLVDYFGPEVAQPVANVVNAIVQRAIAPLAGATDAYYKNLEIQHSNEGFAEAAKALPKSIDLNDQATRQKVEQEAWRLLYAKAQQPGFDPWQYNLRHAIGDAASLLFKQDIQKAERMRLATQQRTALRGSPERGTRSPTGSPKLSEEERLDAAARAAVSGKPLAEIQDAYAGSR